MLSQHLPPTALGDTPAAQLRRTLQARHGEAALVETHISWVVLSGPYAYKLKKPVRFGFLDFSTPELRQHFCEEELRLNQRLVPQLYLGVLPVREGRRGAVLGGQGAVIDHALKMHRLPPDALASERLARGTLEAKHMVRLARRIEAFHRAVPAAGVETEFGTVERVRGDALRALDALAALSDAEGHAACRRLAPWCSERAEALGALIDGRRAAGRVREGHGDLHLDNVLVLGGDVTAFDCIEFDPALRWIDVMNDIAYLLMDLLAHRRHDLAFTFLDTYLEAGGDHEGLPLLRFFIVYRAAVRSLVAALRERSGVATPALGAAEYLRLAERFAGPGNPRLLITHGLPGAGKTHLSQQLLERAGAIRLRSDVERKRLAGLPALADSRVAGDLYTPAAGEATYARLLALARLSLQAECPTIVDAAFLRRAERDRMRSLARELGVPFHIVDCQAPMALLRDRVHARQGDASEADLAVLEKLAGVDEPLADEEREHATTVDTGQPLALASLLGRWFAESVSNR